LTLAEQFQTLVFVMSDLDLGMNNWMADPFKYPEKPISRGKVLSKADLDRLGGFARYQDVDGDGIGYRTLPGHPIILPPPILPEAADTTRKLNTASVPTTSSATWSGSTASSRLPLLRAPAEVDTGKSKIGIIGYGTSIGV